MLLLLVVVLLVVLLVLLNLLLLMLLLLVMLLKLLLLMLLLCGEPAENSKRDPGCPKTLGEQFPKRSKRPTRQTGGGWRG